MMYDFLQQKGIFYDIIRYLKILSTVSVNFPLHNKIYKGAIMGKSNIAIKQFFRDKVRFADLFNGYVFQGKQIITPEDLEEKDSESSIIIQNNDSATRGVQKYRDITMQWKKGASLAILAVENQDKVHYAMPVRTMLYDGLSYADQIRLLWKTHEYEKNFTQEEFLSRFRKTDSIFPVISLVFYYGLQDWDASTDLYGMFQQNEFFHKSPILKQYIPNYSLNLIDAGNVESLERFHSDLHFIFGMLQYKDNSCELKTYITENKDYFENVDLETYQAIGALLHSEKKVAAVIPQTEHGGVNMCKAIDDLYNSGVQEGIEKGLFALIEAYKELDLPKEEIVSRLMEKFSYTKEEVLKYLN